MNGCKAGRMNGWINDFDMIGTGMGKKTNCINFPLREIAPVGIETTNG